MIYCDTSLLISALTTEARSPDTQRWLAAHIDIGLAISPWVDTEFSSAIAMKGRIGDLDPDARVSVLAEWQSLRRSFHIETVRTHHFATACNLIGRPAMRLRSGDALHLALALDRGFDLATLDTDLAAAATSVSVKTINPLAS